MKLVNLVPLKEIDFPNQKSFDSYNQKHQLRPDTKITIAGKVTTAGKAAQKSAPVKGNAVFGKDKGGKVFDKTPKKSDDWMDDLDSIDTSDIKGKADPNADSFKGDDIYSATFKDPQTGKTITVGDAYEREDDSPAYQKAFAYVAKFDPDKEVVMGHPEYGKDDNSSAQLPQKASELDYTHAEKLEKAVNAATGLNGYVNTDDNTDAIMYNAGSGVNPTYTLYFGGNADYNKPDEYRVSLLSTYGNDPSKLGDKIDKTFNSGDEAMKFMVAVAKKYKKELEMDDETSQNESTKLGSLVPTKFKK